MSALKLDGDNVIVGGGLAGLVAGSRLPGRTVLLTGSLGATAVSSGVLSPLAGDVEAEEWFLEHMERSRCRYVRGKCATVSQAIREGLVPASLAYGGCPAFIAVNEERPGFRPIEFMKGRSFQEIARVLDTDDDAVDLLCGLLSGIDADGLLLPPILGMAGADRVRSRICDAVGMAIHEYVTAPSVLGSRLLDALRTKAVTNERLELLDMVHVDRIGDGRVEGKMGTKGKREIHVTANNLFLATGGPLTGFTVEADRMFEPLTGVTVSKDIELDLNGEFLSEHSLMHKGIGPELSIEGFASVRALGATAGGFGLYRALVSGYRAGEGLER